MNRAAWIIARLAQTRHVLVFVACLATLSGCATIRGHQAATTEQLLAAAGFQMLPVDSPERASDLASMPPLKIVARSHDQRIAYTYADPVKCHCVYVGGPKEYSAYQRLVVEKEMEQERLWEEQQAMDWAVWGPHWW
jgi:uncharacterized protein YceK